MFTSFLFIVSTYYLNDTWLLQQFHVSFQRFVFHFSTKLDDDECWFRSCLVVLCKNMRSVALERIESVFFSFNRGWIGWWRMNMSLGDVEFADEWILMLWLPRCHFIQRLVFYRTIYEGTLETKRSILMFYSKQLNAPTMPIEFEYTYKQC